MSEPAWSMVSTKICAPSADSGKAGEAQRALDKMHKLLGWAQAGVGSNHER